MLENQKLWDQRTPFHFDSDFYDVKAFLKGKSSLTPIEMEALSDKVAGKSLLHLQCHFGQDTLSFARMGAKATGVDFSGAAIKKARELNEQLHLDTRFIECNIYDLPDHLDEQFEIVFTSYGVLGWLPDVNRWAAIAAQFLKPGGIFYMAEFHPVLYMYDFENQTIAYDYFGHKNPIIEIASGTYTDRNAAIQHQEYSWNHALSEIITALLSQKLVLEAFREFSWSPYNCFPNMREAAPGQFVFGGWETGFPHIFSLLFRK